MSKPTRLSKREQTMANEISRLQQVITDSQRGAVNTCATPVERTKTRAEELTRQIEGLNNEIAHLMTGQKRLVQDLSDTKDAIARCRLQHADASASLKELLAQPQVVA